MKPIWRVTRNGKNFVGTGRQCDTCGLCGRAIYGYHYVDLKYKDIKTCEHCVRARSAIEDNIRKKEYIESKRRENRQFYASNKTIFQKIAGWFK